MDRPARCFERLQVIHDAVPRSGAVNMALDEMLLGDGNPLLRLYEWAEPTVSFGYFDAVQAASGVARGRAIVRRWTGGGIVEHGDDLTYSLCVPRSCAFVQLRGAESYRRVHAAVGEALDRCGARTERHEDPIFARPATAVGNVCFERPVLHDLLADGKKVAGAAQRRVRAGLLHQGSIRLVFADPDATTAGLACLRAELPRALADVCEGRRLTSDEIARANALADEKYATAAWTNRV